MTPFSAYVKHRAQKRSNLVAARNAIKRMFAPAKPLTIDKLRLLGVALSTEKGGPR